MAISARHAAQLRAMLRRLGAASGPGVVPSAAGHALEAWLMMRLARKAHSSGGWKAVLTDSAGNAIVGGGSFAFPTSQGGVPAKVPGGPSHIRLERRRDDLVLELHLALQWLGRSDVTHECDVSLLPTKIADPLRLNGGGRPRGLPIAAFECKDRPTAGGTDEMRQTVARLFDMALVTMPYPKWGCRMFETRTHRRSGRYRTRYADFFSTGVFGIVRVGPFSIGARGLGSHHSINRYGNVYSDPRVIQAVEKAFMTVLDQIDSV